MFHTLLKINCFSKNRVLTAIAKSLLEKFYSCEIRCDEMDQSVLFAHKARGCTIVAAKICENAVIFQQVSIGANLKYNKTTHEWENVGNPIIGRNVIIADGAKIFGPIIIGENSVVGAGALITKNIPANSIAFGVNQYKPKDENYDYIFRSNMINPQKLEEANKKLIAAYTTQKAVAIKKDNR